MSEQNKTGSAESAGPVGTHVLVSGDPVNGFTFVGPVTPNDPALEHYTDVDPKPDYWWYAPLTALPPITPPVQH